MTNESLISIKCTACGGSTPFNAATTACPHCGGDLRQLAAKTCNNCELQYNPYQSDHCPSCHLGIKEIVCALCGLFYAPYGSNGNRVPCSGCQSQPTLGNGRLEHERPIEDGENPEEEDDSSENEPTFFDMVGGENEDDPEEVDVEVETWMESAMSSWIATSMETCMGSMMISWVETELVTCMHTRIETHIETQFETCFDTDMGTDYDASWMDSDFAPCTDLHYFTYVVTEIIYDCTELHYISYMVTAIDTWIEHCGTSYLETGIDSWIESDVPDYPDDNDGPDKSDVPIDTDVPEDETEDTDCPCDNKDKDEEPAGTSSGENACVDFSIAFGRIPSIPGMGVGRLSLYSGMLVGSLAHANALTYDHVMERRLHAIEESEPDPTTGRGVVKTSTSGGGRGQGARATRHVMLDRTGNPGTGMAGSLNSRDMMSAIMNGVTNEIAGYQEVMGDGTVLYYNKINGLVDKIKLTDGRTVTRQEIESELVIIRAHRNTPSETIGAPVISLKLVGASRRADGFIRQIWNKTDGLLDIVVKRPDGRGKSGYTISWYSPEHIKPFNASLGLYQTVDNAEPLKSWDVTTKLANYVLKPGSSNQGVPRGTIASYPSGGSFPQNSMERRHDVMGGKMGEVKTFLELLEIVERRGELTFPIRWEQPDLTTLIFKRGTGSEAEVCIKKRQGALGGTVSIGGVLQPSPMMQLRLPDGKQAFGTYLGGRSSKADGYKLSVNGDPADEVIDTKSYYKGEGPYTSDKIESVTRTIRKRYGFGDVVVSEEKGYGTPACRKTVHYHDTAKSSRTYGRRLMSILPDGTRVSFNYDKEGRLIKKTKLWVGGGAQITRCTWCNSRPNDRRPATVTTWIKKDGQYAMINRKCYAYLESDALRSETVTVRGRGMTGTSVTVREWYGPDPSKNGQACSWAASRLKRVKHSDGTETAYAYHYADEHGAAYKVETVTGTGSGVVAHRSTMEVSHVNDKGQVVVLSRYVHMGTRSSLPGVRWYGDTAFKLVSQENYEYDLSGKPVKVTGLDGRIRTTEWICKGPLSQTDENGVTTTYQYNSAKNLASIKRASVEWEEGGGIIPDPDPEPGDDKPVLVNKEQNLSTTEKIQGRSNLGIDEAVSGLIETHNSDAQAHAELLEGIVNQTAASATAAAQSADQAAATAASVVNEVASLVHKDRANIINGATSFTQAVTVADASAAGHAVSKGQVPSETITWLMKKGLLNNSGTWGYMKDWDYNTLAAPCSLTHFVRGETYHILNYDTTAVIAPSRLVLSTSSTDTGWRSWAVPSITFFPIIAEVWERYNLKIGLGFNVSATASTPQSYDDYPFINTWQDPNYGKPGMWWADMQFKNCYDQPERIRVMAAPDGSPQYASPVLVTKALTIPSNAKIIGLLLLVTSQYEGDGVSRAAICAVDSVGNIYRLYDFEQGMFWPSHAGFTLSLFISKPESGMKFGSGHTIKGPVRIYSATDEATALYKSSIIAYADL